MCAWTSERQIKRKGGTIGERKKQGSNEVEDEEEEEEERMRMLRKKRV